MNYGISTALINERAKNIPSDLHPWFERGMIEGANAFEHGSDCVPSPKSHMNSGEKHAFNKGYITGFELYQKAFTAQANKEKQQ